MFSLCMSNGDELAPTYLVSSAGHRRRKASPPNGPSKREPLGLRPEVCRLCFLAQLSPLLASPYFCPLTTVQKDPETQMRSARGARRHSSNPQGALGSCSGPGGTCSSLPQWGCGWRPARREGKGAEHTWEKRGAAHLSATRRLWVGSPPHDRSAGSAGLGGRPPPQAGAGPDAACRASTPWP